MASAHPTRREFLKGTAHAALGGSVMSALAQSPAVRLSMKVFIGTHGKVDQLRRLFTEMRKKKASDPSSYFFQAAVHWLPDLSKANVQARPDFKVLADMYNQDPESATAQNRWWLQCTHKSLGQAPDFLLWHRAYLYYFERHARKTLGEPNFSVPYWDYRVGDATSRELPTPFAGATLPGGGANSLYPQGGLRRDIDSAGSSMRERAVNTSLCMANTFFFRGQGLSGFGVDGGEDDSIDERPHGSVHGSIGGWMGDVATAGFDPVFWVHHANIDRLFNLWLASGQRFWSRTMSAAEVDAWLDAKPYKFVDANGQEESRPRRFFLDQSNLGYVYDTDPPSIPPPRVFVVAQAAAAGVIRQGATTVAIPKEIQSFIEQDAGGSAAAAVVPASKGATFNVPLTMPPGQGPAGGGNVPLAVLNQNKSKFTYTILVLEEVRRRGEQGGNYAVYVGPQADGARDESSPAFAGEFSTFRVPVVGSSLPAGRYSFDITRQVASLKGPAETLQVRIAPLGPNGPDGKPMVLDKPGTIEVGKTVIRSRIGSTNPVK
jgi:hypothetical protein